VIAAHPDDAEISVGGTILRLVDAGRAVGVLDLTRGEMGSRGANASRDAETAAATELLGLAWRGNLDLPDGRVVADVAGRERVAALLRELAPDLVLAHHTDDLHPDHAACGRLAREGWYLSGLRKLAALASGGPPARRPARLLHFPGHLPIDPTYVVDVTGVWARKVAAIRAYATQLAPAHAGDKGDHFLFGADILARAEARARYWGERIGAAVGEPLLHVGALPAGPEELLPNVVIQGRGSD
jgi:bacillithiol biosynthesis deacetylase BshB1